MNSDEITHSPSPPDRLITAATLPTRPPFRRTFIPCGWESEWVRISCTIPRVFFPLRWSSFLIISTVRPTRTDPRCCPFLPGSMICRFPAPICCLIVIRFLKEISGRDPGSIIHPDMVSKRPAHRRPSMLFSAHLQADSSFKLIRAWLKDIPGIPADER
jgi:hypothetical protein